MNTQDTGATPAATAPTPPAPGFPTKPTVGRLVLYIPTAGIEKKGQPYPAIITHVFSDGVVNLHVLHDGSFPLDGTLFTSVSQSNNGEGHTWDWMPYQYAQAKKADTNLDALTTLLNDTREGIDRTHGRIADVTKAFDGRLSGLHEKLELLTAGVNSILPTVNAHADRLCRIEQKPGPSPSDISGGTPSPESATGGPLNFPSVFQTASEVNADSGKLYSRKADSPLSPPCNQADHHLGQAIENLNAYIVSPGADFPAAEATALIARIGGVQSRLRAAIDAARAPVNAG